VRIGVRVDRAELLAPVRRCLPPGWQPGEPGKVQQLYSWCAARTAGEWHRLYAGRKRLLRTRDPDEVLGCLESDLQLRVAEVSPRYVFVHAGVVGWEEQAVILPGRSFSGKSTLVAALLRAGAAYYSDEYAVLDDRGRVHPYARLLSLRQFAGQAPLRCAAEALGGRPGGEPLPVGLVVLAQYRPGARWQPRPLSAGEGVLALLNHTVPVRRRPEAALAVLGQVVVRARVLRTPRGEAEEAARHLLHEVGRRSPAPR
jgi:hypothetical protein